MLFLVLLLFIPTENIPRLVSHMGGGGSRGPLVENPNA